VDDAPGTRLPTGDELELIRTLDPKSLRDKEIK
jgi:hypothetical protein